MAKKRRNTSSPEPDDLSSPQPRNLPLIEASWDESDEEDGKEKPWVDEHSGQVAAFPGLANNGDEPFYGPAADGVDYLRMVRSEAKGIPFILTAPAEATHADVESPEPSWLIEAGGYYYDGAYTATTSQSAIGRAPLSSAQQHYYNSLLAQFRLVQATLRCVPPLSEIQSLTPLQPISFPEGSRKARVQWESIIVSHNPHPVQVACMDSGTILELVRLLQRRLNVLLQHTDEAVIRRIGSWAWALLGRCRDRGELSAEDVGEIRALAQRAVKVPRKQTGEMAGAASDEEMDTDVEGEEDLSEQQDACQEADVVGGGSGSLGEQKETLKTTKVSANAAGQSAARDKLIEITLDMIITVVGEVYGQRDLLDLRPRWGDEK